MFAILGATGKLGRATIKTLRQGGHPVRAIVRDPAKGAEFAAAGCEVAVAHLGDKASLEAAFAGASAVQIICPVLGRSDDAFGEMTGMIDTAAAALAAARAPAVVAISDYGAEVPEGTGVTLVFHHLEQRLGTLDASLTFVRSAEHMQNWARHIRAAADTGTLPSMHHPLTKQFPTVASGDVGVITADLLTTARGASSPRIVHVEGPRRYTALDAAAAFSAILGREVIAREVPRADWFSTLQRGGIGESYAKLVVALYDAHNAGRIDVEAGVGEVRRGTTELRDILAGLPRPAARPS
jgi:NAD(P)H dehydrogenase (quinone)